MAHYALLDENNIVINVITGVDENVIQTDLDGTQVGGSTEAWETFYALQSWLNAKSCKRTSYNNNIRYNYAGIGFIYDDLADAFIAPKPDCGHDELLLNQQYRWECSNAEHDFKTLA
jgi:hypothetical protein